MKFRAVFMFSGLMLLSILLASCPDIMSSSWGAWAKRDPKIPSITFGNIKGLLREAVGDTGFARALLDKIVASSRGASGAQKEMLEGAGISAAALASGLDTLVLTSAGALISASGDMDDVALAAAVEDIFNKVKGNDQRAVANQLVDLLGDEDWETSDTGHKAAILANTETDKLIISAMVLLIAQAQTTGGSFSDYLDDFASRQGNPNPEDALTGYEKTALCLAGIAAGNVKGMEDLFDFLELDNKGV